MKKGYREAEDFIIKSLKKKKIGEDSRRDNRIEEANSIVEHM